MLYKRERCSHGVLEGCPWGCRGLLTGVMAHAAVFGDRKRTKSSRSASLPTRAHSHTHVLARTHALIHSFTHSRTGRLRQGGGAGPLRAIPSSGFRSSRSHARSRRPFWAPLPATRRHARSRTLLRCRRPPPRPRPPPPPPPPPRKPPLPSPAPRTRPPRSRRRHRRPIRGRTAHARETVSPPAGRRTPNPTRTTGASPRRRPRRSRRAPPAPAERAPRRSGGSSTRSSSRAPSSARFANVTLRRWPDGARRAHAGAHGCMRACWRFPQVDEQFAAKQLGLRPLGAHVSTQSTPV